MHRPILAALSLLLVAPSPAQACGQSTHVHIGRHALEHLPADSDLRAILTERLDLLINGAMFPDGGYSPLTMDAYGEIAHWEPFQKAYLDWTAETFPDALCSEEALDHITLALGMAAHGMGDQVYDALYLERSEEIEPDAWQGGESVDKATDVTFTAAVGPQPIPEDVVPYEALPAVFARVGHTVSASTIATGQASLRIAVAATSGLGQDPTAVAKNEALYPWATTHLTDPSMPGAPACIGEVVAAYWQAQWDRLHQRFDDGRQWVVWTWPQDGQTGWETDPTSLDSQLALVFGKTVDVADVDAATMSWTADDGTVVPFRRRMYYRDGSNVLLLTPQEALADDTRYTFTIAAGMLSRDDSVLSTDVGWSFTTGTHGGTEDTDLTEDGPGKGAATAADSITLQPAACPDKVPEPVDTDTDHTPDDSLDTDPGAATSGCGGSAGCATGSAPTGWVLGALGLGLIRRRRRRRAVNR